MTLLTGRQAGGGTPDRWQVWSLLIASADGWRLDDRLLQDNSVTLTLQIEASLFWFHGHFPTLPILPGVAQLDWAMHYSVQILAPGKQFATIDNIKFQQPVLPDSLLQMRLDWDVEKSRLSFRYSLLGEGDPQSASSGKITLC